MGTDVVALGYFTLLCWIPLTLLRTLWIIPALNFPKAFSWSPWHLGGWVRRACSPTIWVYSVKKKKKKRSPACPRMESLVPGHTTKLGLNTLLIVVSTSPRGLNWSVRNFLASTNEVICHMGSLPPLKGRWVNPPNETPFLFFSNFPALPSFLCKHSILYNSLEVPSTSQMGYCPIHGSL